jgi:hypothetical protein
MCLGSFLSVSVSVNDDCLSEIYGFGCESEIGGCDCPYSWIYLSTETGNEILIQSGDGNGGGDVDGGGRRTHLTACSPVVPSGNVTGSNPVEPVVVAETAVARFGIGVESKTAFPVGPVEVVSEAYIVAGAAEGGRIVGRAVAMLDMEGHKVSSVSMWAFLAGAESFGSILALPLCLRCRCLQKVG